MSDRDQIQAQAARDYVRILNATGGRLANRDTVMFCEAVEAAEAMPAPAADSAPIADPPVTTEP